MMVKVNKKNKNKKNESIGAKKGVKNLISKRKEGKGRTFRGKRLFRRGNRSFPKYERGVVYLKHIPHGFFEDQILKYFKQFGRVTGHNLPRAKTGNIKGYAFIEFKHPEVAKIAAEAMNNYLMFDRLLKAEYIPPEKQKPQKFALAAKDRARKTTLQDVAKKARLIDRTNKNRLLSEEQESEFVRRQKRKIYFLHKKLTYAGIDYDFQVANEPVELTKVSALPEDKHNLVVEVDDSDDEISFKTPPNVVKKSTKKSKIKKLLLENKENEKIEKKERKKGKEKAKKRSRLTKTTSDMDSVVAEEENSPSTLKKSLDNLEDDAEKKQKEVSAKISDKNTKNKTKVINSEKSDNSGGILKKFKKSVTTENKKIKSKILGLKKKSKVKPTNIEPDKVKKKLKGLNLAGVKHIMNTVM